VWAIGTGKTATPQQAEEVHRYIREKLERLSTREIAGEIRIQYGGSVTPENVKGLMNQDNIDGPSWEEQASSRKRFQRLSDSKKYDIK